MQKKLYSEKSDTEIATMILSARKKNPIPPSYFNDECPKEVDNILLKAIERDLGKRYKDANEFYNDIISLEQ